MKSQIPSGPGSASAALCAAWVILLALILLLSLRGWGSFQVGAYQDDAIYLVLARSIAFGPHYGLINAPGFPPASKFPFGFPLVLAPVLRAFPHDLLLCTLVPLLATLLNVSLLVWGWPFLGPGTSRWWGLGSAWLYGLGPRVIGATRMVMSEPFFLLLVLVALILTEWRLRDDRRRRWFMPTLGIVLMLVVFTRWVGIVVCAAVCIRLALAARSRSLRWFVEMSAGALGALMLVLIATPIDLQQLAPQRYLRSRQEKLLRSGTEQDQSTTNTKTAAHYATQEVRNVIVALGGGERERETAERLGVPYLPHLFSAAITLLVVFGAWCGFRRGWLSPGVALFEVLYVSSLAMWPFINPRLLYPILPFLFVQFLIAIHVLATAIVPRRGPNAVMIARGAVVVTCALLTLASLWKSMRIEDTRALTGDLSLVPRWLKEHTADDAIVMTQSPQLTFLYGQRTTVPLVEASSVTDFDQSLRDRGVDYVLLEPEIKWRAAETRAYAPYVRQTLLPIVAELAAQGRLALAYEPTEPLLRVYQVTADTR
jgi:hypothetical protein